MGQTETIATMIKLEQLQLFNCSLGRSFKDISELFDKYKVWQFIDEAYEGLHVQGASATFEDINSYLSASGAAI